MRNPDDALQELKRIKHIAREERVDGFIDYPLVVQTRRFVAVEAKKEGVSFTFPEPTHRSLKLSGTVLC